MKYLQNNLLIHNLFYNKNLGINDTKELVFYIKSEFTSKDLITFDSNNNLPIGLAIQKFKKESYSELV